MGRFTQEALENVIRANVASLRELRTALNDEPRTFRALTEFIAESDRTIARMDGRDENQAWSDAHAEGMLAHQEPVINLARFGGAPAEAA